MILGEIQWMETAAPLLTAAAMSVACAMLSVFVVSRRWAFIGEGIAHSGFGGAGTIWLLTLLFPRLGSDDLPWLPYLGVAVFSMATAWAIAYFTRGGRVNSDAVIGIFLVASLAWGILGQFIYRHVRKVDPVGWDTFLFGRMSVSMPYAVSSILLSIGTVGVMVAFWREMVAYAFDPPTAEASGVNVAFIHYLLMSLVAVMIIVGVRLAGNVLVTALLVLPGATAVLSSTSLRTVVRISILVAAAGTVGGVTLRLEWPFLPSGPLIVLLLFGQFVGAYALTRLPARSAA